MSDKPDLLVLLGSGATMPEIPGVSQLTKMLRAQRIFDRIARGCEVANDVVSPQAKDVTARPDLDSARDEILKKLAESKIEIPLEDGFTGEKLKTLEIDAAKFYEAELHQMVLERGPRPDAQQRVVNFEDLLGIAEVLSRHSSFPNYASLFLERSRLAATLPGLQTEHVEGCYAVLKAISEACDKVESEGKQHPLVEGLERLAEHFRLQIFSLNYDDIPEHSRKLEFFTGYPEVSRGTGWINGSYRFLPLHLYLGKDHFDRTSSHLHLQMHGSVLFGPDRLGQGTIPRFPDRASALKSRSWAEQREGSSYQTQGGGAQLRLPMVTGYGKAEATLWEPFGTYLGALRRAAMLTPTWLIIGYSGSDVHVNACLKSAMRQSVEVNHVAGFRHAVIVDFFKFSRERRLDLDLRDPIGHALINKLFVPWAEIDIHESASYEFLKQGTYFHPKTFNRISKRLSVSLDGGAWALVDGIEALTERLLTFQADEPSRFRRRQKKNTVTARNRR